MYRSNNPRSGFAWLEALLAIATLVFLFQVFPALWQAIDFQNWSRITALVVNVLALLLLAGIKTGPNLIVDFREWRQRSKVEHAKAEKSRMRMEQREAMERLQESRRRRKF